MSTLFSDTIKANAVEVLRLCTDKKLTVTTVESCTGGLIAACLTDIPGSSAVIDRGYITYSYQAKIDLVGVKEETLAQQGAVSRDVAEQMALGALKAAGTDIAIAVTGIAGPGGATPNKPVGLVYITIASKNGVATTKNLFSGDRTEVRLQTVQHALQNTLLSIKDL